MAKLGKVPAGRRPIERPTIHAVKTFGGDRWFLDAPLQADADSGASLDKTTDLRLIAVYGARRVARLPARWEGEVLKFWSPQFAPGVDERLASACGRALVEYLEHRARSRAGLIQRMQTEPADDDELPAVWLETLGASGFRELARACVHVLAGGGMRPLIPLPAGLMLRAPRGAQDPVLFRVYKQSVEATSDRLDRLYAAPAREHFAKLERLAGSQAVKRFWRVARVAGQPCGYIAVADNYDGGDGERAGWILGIGVDPPFRRRGIGTALLSSAVAALGVAGESKIKALIDNENGPSIAVHEKLGFKQLPARYMTYEKRIFA